jgi:hypothetical protein
MLVSGVYLRFADILDVIIGASVGRIDGAAGRPVLERSTLSLRNRRSNTLSEGQLLLEVVRSGGARIAVGKQDELAVAVPVDEELETLAGSQVIGKSPQAQVLGRVARLFSTVGFVGRVGRRAIAFPLVRPVAVDVGAHGADAVAHLTVLTPETVGRLGINEALSCQQGCGRAFTYVETLPSGLTTGMI